MKKIIPKLTEEDLVRINELIERDPVNAGAHLIKIGVAMQAYGMMRKNGELLETSKFEDSKEF